MAETCSTVAILPGNYFSERYYRPEGSLHPWRNCKHGCRLLWSVEPFKKQPALTVFQVQAAFSKIRTLVVPCPQQSTIATQHIHLTTIGILQYLSPGLQFLLGLTAFHEPFSRMQFAGYLWVWAGVALFVWGARNTKTT